MAIIKTLEYLNIIPFACLLTVSIGIYDVELVQKQRSAFVIWLKFKLGFASLVCF